VLYLVPTPIGNLADMTLRAIEVLKEVSLVLAEDTRTSGKLLKHYEIETPMRAFHQHNEHRSIDSIVEQLATGQDIALISDAGSPGISDPGFLLVRACAQQGLEVQSLPGPTAFVPALTNSGFPTDRFVFEGFLPHKKGRSTRLKEIAQQTGTIVLYESPHRIPRLLKELQEHLSPGRLVSVSREISKLHEETLRGEPNELALHFESHPPKGEFVLVIDSIKKQKAPKSGGLS